MIDSKMVIIPLCFGVISSLLFYLLIDRIGGGLFISIFFGVFFCAFFAESHLLGQKSSLQFSLLATVALIIAYFVSLIVGVATVNQLLSFVVGNSIIALSLFALDYYFYGTKMSSGVVYLLTSFVSIIVIYLISIYSDKDGLGAIYSMVYSSIIYCYLQAYAILHH